MGPVDGSIVVFNAKHLQCASAAENLFTHCPGLTGIEVILGPVDGSIVVFNAKHLQCASAAENLFTHCPGLTGIEVILGPVDGSIVINCNDLQQRAIVDPAVFGPAHPWLAIHQIARGGLDDRSGIHHDLKCAVPVGIGKVKRTRSRLLQDPHIDSIVGLDAIGADHAVRVAVVDTRQTGRFAVGECGPVCVYPADNYGQRIEVD